MCDYKGYKKRDMVRPIITRRRALTPSREKFWISAAVLCSTIFVLYSSAFWSPQWSPPWFPCTVPTASKSIITIHQDYLHVAASATDLRAQIQGVREMHLAADLKPKHADEEPVLVAGGAAPPKFHPLDLGTALRQEKAAMRNALLRNPLYASSELAQEEREGVTSLEQTSLHNGFARKTADASGTLAEEAAREAAMEAAMENRAGHRKTSGVNKQLAQSQVVQEEEEQARIRRPTELTNHLDSPPNEPHFLFIAVVSYRWSGDRRQAVRDSWAKYQYPGVALKFVLYEEEFGEELAAEFEQYQDLVYIPTGDDPNGDASAYRTYFFMEWLVEHVDAKFVAKTQDDTYVAIPALLRELSRYCREGNCTGLYLGEKKQKGEVIVEAAMEWAKQERQQPLNYLDYKSYMYSGGYVFSMDIAWTVVQTQQSSGMKFLVNEDATFGYWVSQLNATRVDHPLINTSPEECGFSVIADKGNVGRFEHLSVQRAADLCAGWLMCHRVSTASEMKYIHYRMQQCKRDTAVLSAGKDLAANRQPPQRSFTDAMQVYMVSNYSEGYHFYGDLPSSPWSPDGMRVLSQRIPHSPAIVSLPVNLTHVTHKDVLQVVVTDVVGPAGTLKSTSWPSRVVGNSTAWNHRHGCHATWLGSSSRHIIYNDRECKGLDGKLYRSLCSVLVDIETRETVKTFRFPVVAVDPEGKFGISMDLTRLEEGQPGSGYARPLNSLVTNFEPKDGIWKLDLETGDARLLVTYSQLYDAIFDDPKLRFSIAYRLPSNAKRACLHWVSPPQLSGSGDSLVFSYNIGHCRRARANFTASYLFTMDSDGTQLWRVPLSLSERFFYNYGATGLVAVCQDEQLYVVQNRHSVTRVKKPKNVKHMVSNGCRFAPTNPQFLVVDDWFNRQIAVLDLARNDAAVVGQFWPNWQWWDGTRPELLVSEQPHFSRDGRYLTFQSSFRGATGLQMYLIGIQNLQVAGPAIPAAPTDELQLRSMKVFIDLAVRSGDNLRWFLQNTPDVHEYIIHAFESSSLNDQQMQALTAALPLCQAVARKVTLHFAAAGVAESITTVNDRGISRDDMSMDQILWDIFRAGSDPSKKVKKWWQRLLQLDVSPQTGHDVVVPTTHFGAWLKGNFEQDDYVVVAIDLGNGREFQLLESMLMDGTLLLIDKIYITWHYQKETWHLVLLYEEIFAMLNIPFEYLRSA